MQLNFRAESILKLKSLVVATALSLPVLSYADWTPYVGIGGGYQYTTLSTSVSNTYNYFTTSNLSDQLSYPLYFYTKTGQPMLDLFAGIGNVFQNNVYLGFNIDAYYSNTSKSSSLNTISVPGGLNNLTFNQMVNASMRWRFQLSGIVGYQVNEHWLPYVTAGLSTARLNANYLSNVSNSNPIFNGPDESPFASAQTSNQLYGVNIGLGTRYMIDEHWFLKFEADYTRYLNLNTTTPAYQNTAGDGTQSIPAGSTPYGYIFRPQAFSLNAGIGYQF